MRRLAACSCVATLSALLCSCVTEQRDGDSVTLMREVMVESAKSNQGQQSLESPERVVRAVGDWREADGGSDG